MKLDAKVHLNIPDIAATDVTIPVDADYVHADEEEIFDWVAEELYNVVGRSVKHDEFSITNIDAIMEDLANDEFEDKTQYRNY